MRRRPTRPIVVGSGSNTRSRSARARRGGAQKEAQDDCPCPVADLRHRDIRVGCVTSGSGHAPAAVVVPGLTRSEICGKQSRSAPTLELQLSARADGDRSGERGSCAPALRERLGGPGGCRPSSLSQAALGEEVAPLPRDPRRCPGATTAALGRTRQRQSADTAGGDLYR